MRNELIELLKEGQEKYNLGTESGQEMLADDIERMWERILEPEATTEVAEETLTIPERIFTKPFLYILGSLNKQLVDAGKESELNELFEQTANLFQKRPNGVILSMLATSLVMLMEVMEQMHNEVSETPEVPGDQTTEG